ncbi:MAG: FAD-binding protein [Desulfurococcales archaeon]|nr:FAD-binding protein [Desulfurococcales archaeon]
MGESAKRAVESLVRTLGRGKVVSDPEIVSLYSREASGLMGEAWAVVFPEDAGDVGAVLSIAYRHEVPVYPQGSATSLSGSSVPSGGIIVSLDRMRRIREVSILDSLAVVEPGLRLGDLNMELSRHGYMFPVDPGSVSVATVGGAINSGAGGMRGAKYGTMRDWVLGLKLAVPDAEGSILEIGCRTLKCRQGYDLTRLVVGSEGTLGIVVEANLRITPMPEAVVYGLGFYKSLEGVVDALKAIKEAGVQPLIAEFMDQESATISSRRLGSPIRPEGHLFLVGVDANREASQRMASWIRSVLESSGAAKVTIAGSQAEAESLGLLEVRRGFFAASIEAFRRRLGRRDVMVYIEDIAVPPSRIPEVYEQITSEARKRGLHVVVGGHIGDGNLHPTVGFNPEDPRSRSMVEEWYSKVMEIAVKSGGTISAEHGIGVLKKKGLQMELEARGSRKLAEIMTAIKRAFDPKGLMNPSKVIELGT